MSDSDLEPEVEEHNPEDYETWELRARFTVKEYGDGQPFIDAAPLEGLGIPQLHDGNLGLDLPDGTSIERAREICEFLNQNLTCITFTALNKPEYEKWPGRVEKRRRRQKLH